MTSKKILREAGILTKDCYGDKHVLDVDRALTHTDERINAILEYLRVEESLTPEKIILRKKGAKS